MACGDTGDVNVFLPRVSDHLPSQTPTTSLLTFADMVLALDNNSLSDSLVTNLSRQGKNLQDDHNYASNKTHKMTTRSQALRINNQCQMNEKRNLKDRKDNRECLSNSDPGEVCAPIRLDEDSNCSISNQDYSPTLLNRLSPISPLNKNADEDRKVKRSSSVENIFESISIDTYSEWPQTSRKSSPRKSCSFEEVNKNTGSHKPEDKQRGGSSGQLHRLVNDTLEFPCWPRKADHTYATATWDGTAASHSLFEQELNQENLTHTDEMEVTESYNVSPFKKKNNRFGTHLDEHNRNISLSQNYYYQKEDHTYVKHNSNVLPHSFSLFEVDNKKTAGYSCSTFPRQKTRGDHTYFSSGSNKHSISSYSGKDWNSLNTVTQAQHKDRTDIGLGKKSSLELYSAKKDHNYFTSA